MSTPEERDWVRQGTPRDVDAEWNDEQSEYGTTVSPVEWDDYSSEQSVPVERPRPTVPPPVVDEPTAPDNQPTADVVAASDVEATDAGSEQVPEGGVTSTSDDAAVLGAPLEDQPTLVDAEPGLEPVPEVFDEPVDAADPGAVDQHAAGDRDGELAPETDIPEPVAADEPSGFERPADEPFAEEPGADDPVAAEPPASEPFAEESFEEETLEEPSIDDYDEPQDDEAFDAVPPVVPAGEAPVEDDAYTSVEEPAPVADPFEAEDAALDEPGADDVAFEDPATEDSVLEDASVADSAVDDSAVADGYDPDATRVTPAVGRDTDATDELTATDDVANADYAADNDYDPDATQVVPAVAVGAAGAAGVAGASAPDDVYRTGETAVIDDREALAARAREADEAEARERELQTQLDAERRARDERLGVVATSSDNELRDPATAYKVSTDRFFGSLGLFVLRLVTAAILGITGYQVLTNLDQTTEFLSQTAIPEPRLVTWILGFTLGALALLLVIGLVQRAVGVVLLLLSVGSLVFIRWGSFSPFVEGREGFLGDKTLLLAAVGFVLIGVGGGLWGVDGAFRRARAAAKAEKS